MALTGLEIYKLLPKTNCKECGFPTCLAFAMKLSQKGTELDKCPYVSDESKTALDAASAPPIRLVAIGAGDRAFEIGNEVVLFRHEKTFYHQPGLFVRLAGDDPGLAAKAQQVGAYSVERVGRALQLDGIAVEQAGDAAGFTAAVTAVRAAAPGLPLLLLGDAAGLEPVLAGAAAERPLIGAATAADWQLLAALAVKYGCPLLVSAEDGDLQALADLAEQVHGAGVDDIVLDPGARDLGGSLAALTKLRRLALKKGARVIGYPLAAFAGAATLEEEAALAAQAVAKYAGVIVLDHIDPALFYTLLTLRQNIYTDPQKPIQVEPGLYEIGKPGPDSPLLVTVNFSLTYFTVSSEIEGCGIPAWLLVADADGLSVLTSWAAGKFDAEKIAKTVKDTGIADRIDHRKLVLPGLVAGLSGEVEDELPDWQILIGPRDAVDLPSYLKTVWSA